MWFPRKFQMIHLGYLLILLSIIAWLFTPYYTFTLVILLPMLVAFLLAIHLSRNMGALAIALYITAAVISVLVGAHNNAMIISPILYAILLISALAIILHTHPPERGHGKERLMCLIFTVLLLCVFYISVLLIPPINAHSYIADNYVFYNLLLLAVLTGVFTIIKIATAHLSQNFKFILLSDLHLNLNLAMFTVEMFSVPAIYIDLAGMCSCSGCFSTIVPGLTALMLSLIAPSTSNIIGHIYAGKKLK